MRTRPSAPSGATIETSIARVLDEIGARDLLAYQSEKKVEDTLRRLVRFFVKGFGVDDLAAVTAEAAHAFVTAPLSNGDASVATMHLRRCVLRLFFRVARDLGLADSDPTLDLRLPPRSSLRLRPLTDDEVSLCRSYSLETLTSTRASAAWALAEATATTSEIPAIRVCDLQLDRGRIWIAGATKTEPRWGVLDEWCRAQLERRVRSLSNADTDRPVIYEGSGSPESRQASSCLAISQTLVRAGLANERDVRPASVAAWAGARLLAAGAPIDEVARRLGKRSLDRTARFIGWDWRSTDG
jgi:integrase/recombinase XerC